MILLAVSGVLLWTQLYRRRLVGLAIFAISSALTLAFVLRSI